MRSMLPSVSNHVSSCAPFLEALVETVEYLGADSLLLCRSGSEAITARVPGRVGFSAGDLVTLGWAQGAVHLFDETGARSGESSRNEPVTMLA